MSTFDDAAGVFHDAASEQRLAWDAEDDSPAKRINMLMADLFDAYANGLTASRPARLARRERIALAMANEVLGWLPQ